MCPEHCACHRRSPRLLGTAPGHVVPITTEVVLRAENTAILCCTESIPRTPGQTGDSVRRLIHTRHTKTSALDQERNWSNEKPDLGEGFQRLWRTVSKCQNSHHSKILSRTEILGNFLFFLYLSTPDECVSNAVCRCRSTSVAILSVGEIATERLDWMNELLDLTHWIVRARRVCTCILACKNSWKTARWFCGGRFHADPVCVCPANRCDICGVFVRETGQVMNVKDQFP